MDDADLKTRTCAYCGEQVYWETDRLVEVRSGDDGGTYDCCQEGPEHRHSVRKPEGDAIK